jgi:hypothetical protein
MIVMTALREHDVDTTSSFGQPWDAAEGPPDSLQGGRGASRLDALRLYLQQLAHGPSLEPNEETALCREIDAAHRALTTALLAVPLAALRLRELCATVRRGSATDDDRAAHADEIIEALAELSRARCEAVARARVTAVRDGRVDGSRRPELLASIERSMPVMSSRSAFIEKLAAEIMATADGSAVEAVECSCERLRDLKLRLLAANRKLVVSEAVRYRHPDVSLLELVQEGDAALRKAVDRFAYRGGFDFPTYATSWIRQAIRRALRRHRTPRAVS